MNTDPAAVIRRHARELDPIPTGRSPRLPALSGVKAVLFDIYGTLLVSGVGEVGTAVEQHAVDALRASFHESGFPARIDAHAALEQQREVIHDEHARLRSQGIDYPEVDIVAVWRETLLRLRSNNADVPDPDQLDLELLALSWESRTNPVWPMPNAQECLAALREAGITIGIVSNAQFFTLLLFPVLFSADLSEMGFDRELCFFSWRYEEAKPSSRLFGLAAQALAEHGISPESTLYVGNDMLNDVTGAAGVGFLTALFAGDERSLRLREGDPRIEGIIPDLELTDLSQLPSCVTT